MENPWILKLQQGVALNDDDLAKLLSICKNPQPFKKGQMLINAGQEPRDVHLILSGFAYRYKILTNGKRQIMAFLLPGDFCDLNVSILGEMDHTIGTLSRGTVVELPRAAIEELRLHAGIMPALWWATLVDEAILREWLVNMGQRPASQQIAHLFCELYIRLDTVRLVTAGSFNLPVNQEELGETLGLSAVHVNRTLQDLRAQGLITLKGRSLTVHDLPQLKAFADFQDDYLHLKRPAKE